jgi:hypothetical protein
LEASRFFCVAGDGLGGGLAGGLDEKVEGFSEGAGDAFAIVDFEALEQGLVQEPSGAG